MELYNKYLTGIKEAYNSRKSWEDVIISEYFYSDEMTSIEAFIDFVEDVYKTKIKDTKQLDKLVDLTSLLHKEQNTEKGKEPTLEYILTSSRYSKYFRSLKKALQNGAKYKDLLKIKPQSFGLENTWSGCLSSDQYSSILWTIALYFNLDEVLYFMAYPNLRSIAQEIEAPYSVIMDSYKIINK